MSTIDTSPEALSTATAPPPRDEAVTTRATPATVAWVTSADHKVIGRMLVGTALTVLAATALVGVVLGVERIDGGGTLLDPGAMPQLFTAFRIGLIYGGLLPLVLGIGVGIVPLQLGARALAFPRLAAAGFWTWLGGLALVVIALAGNGGPLGGDGDMVDLFLTGHGVLVIGLAAVAISLATTVLTTRAPGMRLERVPFFSWSVLVTALGLVLLLPVVLGALIYLYVDHRNGRALFGGNAGISSWLGFAWTQPTTYLFALPVIGLLAEVAPVTFAKRTPMRGVAYAGLGLVGIAALAGVSQRHHLVGWDGGLGDKLQDVVVWAFFLLLPVLGVLLVTAVVGLVAKPTRGERPNIGAPIVFAFLGTELVVAGMLAGALTNIVDLGLGGTVFEEAALVLVVYGGALGALGALAYWTPTWTGYTVPSAPAIGLAGLGLIATALAAGPYLVAGFADQPAGAAVYDYGGPSGLWNVLVTAGHALMALTVFAFVGLVVKAVTGRSEPAAADPWRGHTLEWATTAPAPVENFVEPPTVRSPEPVYDLRATPDHGAVEEQDR